MALLLEEKVPGKKKEIIEKTLYILTFQTCKFFCHAALNDKSVNDDITQEAICGRRHGYRLFINRL